MLPLLRHTTALVSQLLALCQVYANTLRNWVSLDADNCRVRTILYTTNSTGVDSHVLTELADQLGWRIFPAPRLSRRGVPFVKELYLDAEQRVPDCSFYAYSNGDILYSRDIIETLEEVSRVSDFMQIRSLQKTGPRITRRSAVKQVSKSYT